MADEKYVVGQHASERLEERAIMEWQTVVGLSDGELIEERPGALPNPTVEVRETLPEAMHIPGKRVKRTRLVQSEKYVVAVEVEMVIPLDDPSEPCYESETIQLLREIKDRADKGDVGWLAQHGKVYAAMGAA